MSEMLSAALIEELHRLDSCAVSNALVNQLDVAGLSIAPGDLLFCDWHGVLSIQPAVAPAVPSIAAEMRQKEQRVIEYCRSGEFSVDKLRSMISDLD